MKHDIIIPKIEPELLNDLLDDENSCVEVYRKHKEHVVLLPYHLINIKESLTSILDARISKYNKRYNGVLLAHKNIQVLPTKSIVNREYVYIHIDIEADLYIFKPEVNKILNGVVNKYSSRHVGALIYNTFNVSIPKPESDEEWLGEQVDIGQEVVLQINFIDYEGRLPYIRAEIISIKENPSNTSANNKIKFDTDLEPDDSQVKIKKKKKKKSKDLCEESVDNDTAEEILDKKVKKSRKMKEVDSSTAEINFTDENGVEEVKSSKKKKSKREKSFQENYLDVASTENDVHIITEKKKRKSKVNNLLKEEYDISGITKLEESSYEGDLEVTERSKDSIKKKRGLSPIQQDFNYENDQNLKKNKVKRKKIEENDSKTDDFSFDLDKPLNFDNLIDNTSILSMGNICMVDDDVKKLKKRRSSTATDNLMDNIKKEIIYDSEIENILKNSDFNNESESKKKRKRSSVVNYDVEAVKS